MGKKRKVAAAGHDEHGFPLTIDSHTLAVLTGVSESRLHQLVRDARISAECKDGEGNWLTARALTEIFGYYRRQADKVKPDLDRQVTRQNELEELRSRRLKNAKMARELLPRHVYVQAWGELLTVFKNRWLNFSHKMGPRAFRAKDKVEAAELLEQEVRNIFAGLDDPKVMEGVETAIRDDEFAAADATDHGPSRAEEAGDLVTENA